MAGIGDDRLHWLLIALERVSVKAGILTPEQLFDLIAQCGGFLSQTTRERLVAKVAECLGPDGFDDTRSLVPEPTRKLSLLKISVCAEHDFRTIEADTLHLDLHFVGSRWEASIFRTLGSPY